MYLIINLGLKSIRGIIFNKDGRVLFSKSLPINTILQKNNVEQSPSEYLYNLDLILNHISVYTDFVKLITHISVTTSSSCLVGLDNNGAPLTNVIMVSDKRAVDIADEIKNDPVYIKLGYKAPYCNASSMIPKIIWFMRNESEIFGQINKWVGVSEYLNFYFTEQYFIDPLSASKYFYLADNYSEDLLNRYSINLNLFPEVKEIGSVYDLSSALKLKYKFDQNCKFVLTTYDAICAVIGSTFDYEKNIACDVSGTVTSVRTVIEKKSDSNSVHFNSSLLLQDIKLINKTIIGSSNNLGGGIIEWYKQSFFNFNDNDVYLKIENQALNVPPGANGVLFLPYLLGERSPIFMPNNSGTFLGIGRGNSISDFTRSIFESCAFVTKGLVDLIIDENLSVDSLTVSGGLARFDLINQIKSDLLNVEVSVIENFESTAIGSLMLLLVGIGEYHNIELAASKIIKIRKVIKPNYNNHLIYKKQFEFLNSYIDTFKDIYESRIDMLSNSNYTSKEVIQNL